MSYTLYACVIVDISNSNVDKLYDYLVPSDIKITVGMRVYVPFGPRKIEGYVLSLKHTTDIDPTKIKSILGIIDPWPILLPEIINLCHHMAKEYHCNLVDCIRLMLPSQMRGGHIKPKSISYIQLYDTSLSLDELLSFVRKNAKKQQGVLKYLFESGTTEKSSLYKYTNSNSVVINSLRDKKLIKVYNTEDYRKPRIASSEVFKDIKLNSYQVNAIENILNSHDKADFLKRKFLLHGVTGSGKTEVYIRCAQRVLDNDKTVIILVPEISLTPQIAERFYNRFGDKAAILHSRLSAGERYDEWRRIRSGDAKIVIGARSAIFAPIANLGLIIIDEEHENSYRSENKPSYDAIDIAKYRCQEMGATLVLGSATPSVKRYYEAEQRLWNVLSIPIRATGIKMPSINIVDMREEINKGNRSIISTELSVAIDNNLKKNHQTILFLNRRGHSSFVLCRSCGHVVKCEFCDVSMTYHSYKNELMCHYCGKSEVSPTVCPQCSSKFIKHFGGGTQKLEEEINRLFPTARIIRMDADTTKKKDSHLNIIEDFKNNKADILIGTQMIAKGLDFPDVTLVGIIAADLSLNFPGYLSVERTFQLIAQVAGRAGRAEKEGIVYIQTYTPKHYSIMLASKHDYMKFYRREIEVRELAQYPPFTSLIRIVLRNVDLNSLRKDTDIVFKQYSELIDKRKEVKPSIIICGISPAPISYIKGKHRWQLFLKIDKNKDYEIIKNILIEVESVICPYGSATRLEIEPVNML